MAPDPGGGTVPEAPTTGSERPNDERAGRLRKRPRRRAPEASPMPVAPPADSPPPAPQAPTGQAGPGFPAARDRRVDQNERALRGLVTTRGTQVPWSAATRAREVGAPTADDLARAEEEVVVVRRNYTPPEPLRNGRAGDAPRPRRRPG